MKCNICGSKTDWDSSFGYTEFIVCPVCYKRLVKTVSPYTKTAKYSDYNAISSIIFELGKIRKEKS